MTRTISLCAAALALLTLSACATDPDATAGTYRAVASHPACTEGASILHRGSPYCFRPPR